MTPTAMFRWAAGDTLGPDAAVGTTASGVDTITTNQTDTTVTGVRPTRFSASSAVSGSIAGTLPVGSIRCFAVQATGRAGTVGPYSAARCTTRPVDDRALHRLPGWSLGSSTGYYLGTFTATRTSGATLARAR